MVLFIDNYDSFTYNLVQMIGTLQPDVQVVRNDALTVEEIAALHPTQIVLSPGPGRPADAGVCEAVIQHFAGQIPILGVCLGHQALCEVMGGTVSAAKQIMHGKQSVISIDNTVPLFQGLPQQLAVARYHSLAAERESLPDCLQIIGQDANGEIMAVQLKGTDVYGVQFHPESILTPQGNVILQNFLQLEGKQYD
jgi:anthranilate synthase component 2